MGNRGDFTAVEVRERDNPTHVGHIFDWGLALLPDLTR